MRQTSIDKRIPWWGDTLSSWFDNLPPQGGEHQIKKGLKWTGIEMRVSYQNCAGQDRLMQTAEWMIWLVRQT